MTGSEPTLRDLLREAEGAVPAMLAVTVLAQVLGALHERRGRGMTMWQLSLGDVNLSGAPPRALLADPSRDPRVRLGEGPATFDESPEALYGADVMFRRLVTGPRGEVSASAARLLRGLERASSLEDALTLTREVGLELLASWDRRRDATRSAEQPSEDTVAGEAVEARQALAKALYAGREPDVLEHGRELSRLLGDAATCDADLAVARGWLEDLEARRTSRREAQRKVSLKLLLTGAPLIFAVLLTGLLGVVMLFSV